MESVWNLLQNPVWRYPSHLKHVAKIPREIKNSNFPQTFSRYGRKWKQGACWVHRL